VVKGHKQHGMEYLLQAVEAGATTVVIETQEAIPALVQQELDRRVVRVERVVNTRLALAELSAQAAGYPAKKLRILGITGTKGKTTSAFVLEHVLRTAGYRTALMGTVKNSIMDCSFTTSLTTPQPDYIHQFLKLCVEQQIDYVVMEVAAQAVTLHRTAGIAFAGLLFTNFSQEHGEFYSSLDDYFAAKCGLLTQRMAGAPLVVNADDERCATLREHNTLGYGLHTGHAQVQAVDHGTASVSFEVIWPGNTATSQFKSAAFIGNYNLYNLLGVATLAHAVGIDDAAIACAYETFVKVPGRMERYPMANGAEFIIDYAHNPSSFKSVLSTLRPLATKLIVIFGCGGERDATKRPVMGSLAAQYADLVILTTDNPRSEDAATIVAAIAQGIDEQGHKKVVTILDRKEAIEYAYRNAAAGTLIALLGKGPDEYQHIGMVKFPFSEAAIIKSL
jgi:UDP-N-acetylmuramyl-tripeptide synthetase